jgi:soluble epoxide hydrolase/lipid-phosphate phosphatase
MITSRLANLHATRFAGFAFLALGYLPPAPAFDMAAGNAYAKATVGYVRHPPIYASSEQVLTRPQEIFGYWQFNSSPGAPALIEQRWDSFLSLLFSATPELIREHFGPSGAFERWLRDDRRAPRAHYLDEKALADISGNLRAGGLAAPLHWYTVRTTGLAAADEKCACLTPCLVTCCAHKSQQ